MRKTITKEFNWDCAHRLWNPAKTEEEKTHKTKQIWKESFHIL